MTNPNSRRERFTLNLINWLYRHGTSEDYRRHLDRAVRLGVQRALELKAQREVLDTKLAHEPGWNPASGEIVNPR